MKMVTDLSDHYYNGEPMNKRNLYICIILGLVIAIFFLV